MVFSGVGKRVDEMRAALEAGIHCFNVESEPELELLNSVAAEMGVKAPVSLRVNPDVDAKTHPYISTGLKENKFGIAIAAARCVYRRAAEMANLRVEGIDCHIGSQLTEISPFLDAAGRVRALVDRLMRKGLDIRFVDIGGGLGITYQDEIPPDPQQYADAIAGAFRGLPVTIILEPGRVLVGNAGVLLTRMLYTKPSQEAGGKGKKKQFFIVDAAMNDLARPSLYGSFHAIEPVTARSRRKVVADVVGPICESGDFLARDRELPAFVTGDLAAVMSAGAYGFSMSSTYNSRPRSAEVMVSGSRFEVVRERESIRDLTRPERTASFLARRRGSR